MHLRGFVHVLENAEYTDHRSRINAFAQSFVVKADVPAGDRDLELLAGFGHAVDHLRELPHDVRLLRIAEVQAIRGTNRYCTGAGDFARRLGDRVHGAKARVEVTPP